MSVKLYVKPEDTPAGRKAGHGKVSGWVVFDGDMGGLRNCGWE